ncbi:coat protein [ssRNA phage Gerhypos.4_35]|uniref:Coat protein n=2 Tax=Leviviricetes TaxID=2842243 RepID=A0A8S5KYN5_9VIRU|nr:coat protein [ssRNA phage Gerhypos.4_35]QDH88077.1 MAG: hypothetical protein H4Bulk46663_000002 [Leviviridae sp.]DAD50255.1 TPA_asm: coat protein [ssRNA phage Gerhypos.4_35]
MFSDPQVVTYAAAAKSLPAISRGDAQSEYKLNDSGVIYDLTIAHQFKARNRVSARLRRDSYASDPLAPASNVLASATVSFVIDFPNVGVTGTDAQSLAKALIGFLTDANVLKMVNGET